MGHLESILPPPPEPSTVANCGYATTANARALTFWRKKEKTYFEKERKNPAPSTPSDLVTSAARLLCSATMAAACEVARAVRGHKDDLLNL
ncbi:unnamed protein product [Merluccius merluccius]